MTYFSWPWDYVFCDTLTLRMEITLQLCFVFVRHCELFLITLQLRYLFGVVTFFCDVGITFYLGTFELLMEVTLQLRFVFVRYCDIFFNMSQLRYFFVRFSYVF